MKLGDNFVTLMKEKIMKEKFICVGELIKKQQEES